ncbi:MAG: Gldg family protein [bacterium]
MFTKKIKYGANYLLITIITLAILMVINFLSTKRFIRLDFTQNKLYTISKSTKKQLKKLDDLVNIKVYFSKKLPPYLLPLQQQVKDILSEYRAYSKQKIQVEFIDPSENKELQQNLQKMGIPQVQLNIREKDKIQVMNAYLGIGIFFEDKKEVIPMIQDTSSFEYDLTRALIKITGDGEKKIAFLSGHEEHNINQEYLILKKELEGQYQVSTADTSKGEPIPNDIDTLIVAGPKNLQDKDKLEIDQFLMKKGKVIFLIDSIEYPQQFLFVTSRNHNLDDLLNHYGIILNKNLILDRVNEVASFSSGYFSYSIPYPFWPKILSENIDKTCPIINKLEGISFPWISSIEIIKEKCKDKKVIELFKTTKMAWEQESQQMGNYMNGYNLDPQMLLLGQPPKKGKQYVLGAYLCGKFTSFYANKPLPIEKGKNREIIKESSDKSQIIVVGDSNFLTQSHLSQVNLTFALNAIDFLSLGEDLIEIRSRETTDRPLKEVSEQIKNICKYANIIGIPCILIFIGFVRFFLKNKEKKMYDNLIASK